MLTVDGLRSFGADVDEGIKRCVNNEAFYLRMVRKALDDKSFERLEEEIAAKDLKSAFETAHALKGVWANLALTPVLKPVAEMTELLRSGTDTDYSNYLEDISVHLKELRTLAAD